MVPADEVGGEEDARHRRQPRGRAGCADPAGGLHHASTPSTGTAYAQRKIAAVDGETAACLTRMAEKAMVSAPAIAIARGRATSAVRAVGIAGAVVRVKPGRLAVRDTVAA